MTRNNKMLVQLFFLPLLLTRSEQLKLLEMNVPTHADLHETTTLSCDFDLAGGKLYSVKWYKDDFEFFRYIPGNNPHGHSLPVSGINVDLNASDMNTIKLTRLSFNSSGTYRCEVSTEAPNFNTVVASGNMTVMALPRDDPVIEGITSSYSVGDYVSGNCTSAKSNPPSILAWYINEVKVDRWRLQPATDETDTQGLHTRTLGLHFQLERHHFLGPGGVMVLRCSATVRDQVRDRTVTPVLTTTLTNQKLAQERNGEAAAMMNHTFFTGLIVIVSTLLFNSPC